MGKIDFEIKFERRLCRVDDELGYFHTWEHYSQPLGASPFAGGLPAGVLSRVYGIIEFANPSRISRIDANKIIFCDEEHKFLEDMSKMQKGKEKNDVEA